MTLEDIEALLHLAQTRDMASFAVTLNGTSLRLEFDANAEEKQASAQEPELQPNAQTITAPVVGLFRARHPLATSEPTNTVEAGTPAAFIQSGPLLFVARASSKGQTGNALVEEGEGVGFGTKLFEVV
ncbi:hypothetical protein NGM99_05710 [Mesorhizobium sp. RP14(2022)]|uniref:Lipoyl-binding domain-containing protein n=1 Tax=Mesorhizobium liriopis TaxID=2953882 RepID=A0ABT1C393_9HYPH|nr:hypothetical protein [Mesorhizobium liriopis]MCO6049285.1 hypothetical protein [Mesorhizobium liriopis]